jgi:hypothetical protein
LNVRSPAAAAARDVADGLAEALSVRGAHVAPMRRRRLLAALALLPASIAGCGGRVETPTYRETPTAATSAAATATPLTETLPLPEPPRSPSAADALAFVREYERTAARNELVEYGAPARRPEVGDPQATLVAEADVGFYLFGACRASARYGDGRGFGTNRHEVPHFVGRDGRHAVGGFSAVVCDVAERAYAASDLDSNAVRAGEQSGAEIHLFRFDGGAHAVSVSVEYLDGAESHEVFSTTVEAAPDAPDPAYEYVLSNIAVRTGTYRVSVDVRDAAEESSDAATAEDHREATAEENAQVTAAERHSATTWTLSGPDDISWHGLSVFVGGGGRPHVGLPAADEPLLVPGPSRCFRRRIEHGR